MSVVLVERQHLVARWLVLNTRLEMRGIVVELQAKAIRGGDPKVNAFGDGDGVLSIRAFPHADCEGLSARRLPLTPITAA